MKGILAVSILLIFAEARCAVAAGVFPPGFTATDPVRSAAGRASVVDLSDGAGGRRSSGSKSFAVDALWPLAESLGGVGRLIGVDFAYRYEVPAYFLGGRFGVRAGGNLDTDGHAALDISILDVRIGRYLAGGSFAPFVHTGAGVHWCRAEQNVATGLDDSGIRTVQGKRFGLSLMGGGGVTAFRTKRLAIELMIEYFVVLADLEPGGLPQGILCSVSACRGTGAE